VSKNTCTCTVCFVCLLGSKRQLVLSLAVSRATFKVYMTEVELYHCNSLLQHDVFSRSNQLTADPEGSNEILVDARGKVTLNFTWLFVGAKTIFFFFVVYVGFKYGHIKLGPPDEPPEFTIGAYL